MSAKEHFLASMLQECILSGDISYAHKLLSMGANPELLLEEGASPLHVAVCIEDEKLSAKFTELLLQFGANPNVRTAEGSTPLHAAAAFGRADNVRLLLDYGGDPDFLDQDGMTVADNIKQSNSQMCKIYLALYRQRQKEDKSTHSVTDSDDTLISEVSFSNQNTSYTSSLSSDSTLCESKDFYIQMIQERFDPHIHQIDVTSPDHPVLVLRSSDDTVVCGSCGSEASGSSDSFHTCQSHYTDSNRAQSVRELDEKQTLRNPNTSKARNHNTNDNSCDFIEREHNDETSDFSLSAADTSRDKSTSDSTMDSLAFDQAALDNISLSTTRGTSPEDITTGSDLARLSLGERSTLFQSQTERPTSIKHNAVRSPNNTQSLDSGLADSWTHTKNNSRTNSRQPSIISMDSCSLSGSSRACSVCSCSSVKVERVIDTEDGFSLIETHLIPQEGEVLHDADCSLRSHNTTILSDWCELSTLSQEREENCYDISIPQELAALNNDELRRQLLKLDYKPGPVTDSTRSVYLRRLVELRKDPSLAKTYKDKSASDFLPEVQQVLSGDLDLSTATVADIEFEMCKAFSDPHQVDRWREGSKKSCFNYFLLDPRVTQNLPVRAKVMGDSEAFECFLRAIFYIGKGVRSRPYAHFKEAIKYLAMTDHLTQPPGPKINHIIDIWRADLGVISLYLFQNVIACEAYTREACMIEALGLKRLTNKIPGNHYGRVSMWPIRKRRLLGVLLLRKAFKIFLSEGERQIYPYDIKG